MNNTVSFKLFFANQNIRRISAVPTTLEAFHNLMNQLYPNSFHPEMTLQYEDSEGDKISISTEIEWQEFLSQFHGSNLLKLHVVDRTPGKYFKDGPKPEPVKLTKENQQQIPFSGIEAQIIEALENLFPAKKILPYNLPTFLTEVLNFQTLGPQVGDLDIDILRFFESLHREAMRLMESGSKTDLLRARELLHSQFTIRSSDPVVLYNLGCVEALLGNTAQALSWLTKSIQNGYANISHMLQDPDLASLRHLEEFSNLIPLIKSKSQPPQRPVRVPEPRAVPESEVPKPEVPKPQVQKPVRIQAQRVLIPEPRIVQEYDVPKPVVQVPVVHVPVPVPEPIALPVQQEEAPVPVPQVVVTEAVDDDLAKELDLLHQMGFLDDSVLIPALNQFRSVDATLSSLFQ